MKRFYISLISIFLTIVLSITIFFIALASFDAKYQNTYYGELEAKTKRLDNLEGNKIVFIGGSSLSFGIKSKEMEEALGMPVSSYGLYASLGTKVMMELAANSINNGDIVILAPEVSKDTYSTMMNYKNILKCFEGNDLYKRLPLSIQMDLLYNYPSFQLEKNKIEIPEEKKPYTKDSFDSYGEIYDELRFQNIMYGYYDPSLMIKPSKELFDDEFISYLNSYNQFVINKGAKLYFAYSPTNRLAYMDDDIHSYKEVIEEKLDFKSLGKFEDYIYNEYYFYDTNFHLNSTGAYLHTKNLVDNLSKELNIEIKKNIDVPSMPLPLYELSGDTVTIDSIVYTKTNNGYFVSDVLDDFNLDKIAIPSEIFNTKVIGISNEAFSNLATLHEIVLPNTITSLGNACFKNSMNLTRVYLYSDEAPLVPATGLLDGASSDIKICIPKNKMKLYTSGYSWMNYFDYLEIIREE